MAAEAKVLLVAPEDAGSGTDACFGEHMVQDDNLEIKYPSGQAVRVLLIQCI